MTQHVSLIGLTVTKKYRGRKKARSLELVLSGSVNVAPSYDRRVDLDVEVRSGENELAAQTLRNLRAEEGRETPIRILLAADESNLLAAHASEEPPMLALTLTVRDDS